MNPEENIPAQEEAAEESVSMTPREIDIVRILVEGNSSREIAEELGISIFTVESHRHNIIKKLGCRNMFQVVALFFRAGLLS